MKILKSHLRSLVVVSLFSLVLSSACNIRSYNEPTTTHLGSYKVRVRPSCQSLSTGTKNRQESDGTQRVLSYELTCGDTKVFIKDNMLTVNGKSYGVLLEGDQIAIDHGKVRVNSEVRAEVR